MLPAQKDRDFFQQAIPLYAEALKTHLHRDPVELEPLRKIGIIAKQGSHVPNLVAKAIVSKINQLYKTRKISGEQLIIFDNELEAFGNICGACERIKNTPIPYSYSAFIKKFIFFYTMTMPFGHAFTLGYYMVPIVIFVFYALASLELIAEEIEDPFGKDPNDLPLMRISSTIAHNVDEIFDDSKKFR
jgi:ion channel-forming bestrophin family protein